MYKFGLVGNCQVAALISTSGSIEWLCFPHPASEPVFGRILDPDGGHFSISGVDATLFEQHYTHNTNILNTEITCRDGSKFRITDFCPRFDQFGRMYRPASIFRIVTPLCGSPLIQVQCKPVDGWRKQLRKGIRGNAHVSFESDSSRAVLHTNMPLTYLLEGSNFVLQEELFFALSWESGLEDDLRKVSLSFLEQTERYWRTWVKHCSIPSLFQKETIRSALALKLHCYEDTGAILAGLTTSLPEKIGGVRNWDYRYCWLRDAYFSLSAFRNLGHFEEMEGFLKFLLNIATQDKNLAPVYALDQSLPLPEVTQAAWLGFANSYPVRTNNQAAEHVQNDVYGELILALSPIFLDERFYHLRTKHLQQTMLWLADKCVEMTSSPDAGLWELRNGWQEHSFSNLMCWAGLDRIVRIFSDVSITKPASLDLPKFERARRRAELAVLAAAKDGAIRAGPGDESLDASLLLLPLLRFPNEAISKKTLETIARDLSHSSAGDSCYLYRYKKQDDFGCPSDAFLICSFWLAQAQAKLGDIKTAQKTLAAVSKSANHLGLYSEHFSCIEKLQLGNFPQAYSHVGLVNAAFAVSPNWDEVL